MDTMNSSFTSTSSTDSDSNSVLSVIFNRNASQQPDDAGVFAYSALPRPLPVGPYAIASFVYVLIDEGRLMSADMRLMWYLKRLGTIQMVDEDLSHDSPEQCKVMSFIPREEVEDQNYSDNSVFVMDAFTRVFFLTAVYNMVYCLDMSPSNCSVDIQRGHVMLDEMIVALSRSIEGFIRPFIVPGSKRIIFEPQVYVTVIVHTPFYTSLAQQVLVQGWLINNRNFYQFINTVTSEMNRLENALAKTKIVIEEPQNFDDNSSHENENTCKISKDEIQKDNSDNNKSINNSTSSKNRQNNLLNSNENVSSVGNNNPDSGFINTLRYGMLAVRLLPQSSISNLIVITDGMITLADIQVLDSVLNQLRCIGVACSFLHVSSQFHPHSSHGHVPYSELMQFISTATSGTYLNSFPKTTPNLLVNYYHDKFIMWSFKRGDGNEFSSNTANLSCTPPRVRPGEWTVRNSNFYGNRQPQLVSKKQISDHIYAHLENIVCCRMREGFIVEDIQFKDAGNNNIILNITNTSKLHIKFILPWTNHIYIEYELIVKWPPPVISTTEPITIVQEIPKVQIPIDSTEKPTQAPEPVKPDGCLNIHYTVVVKGPYEFLHDITCGRNKKSQPRSQFSRQQCQFQLSSCRSSSISITAATTTITKNNNLMSDLFNNTPRILTSKYRQALIARFWLTMRSIVQTDLLIKHLETYSPSTGYLNEYNINQTTQTNKNKNPQQTQKLESLSTPPTRQVDNSTLNPSSPIILSNLNNNILKTDKQLNTGITESKTINLSISGPVVPNKSPLRNGMPLFYQSTSNSNISFSLKQSQVKSSDQQQSNTAHQHQQFADFWKPICTLDPDSQWPKWFSTYRLGGGVLLLRHDQLLPQWLHMANITDDDFQTVTCKEASEAMFALMKKWCTFVLIDNHSYVKCLDKSETHTGNVSFCIARISPRPPSCCGVVLHLAFQSCVPVSVHHKIINDLKMSIELLDSITAEKLLSAVDEKQLLPNDTNQNKMKENENCFKKKKQRQQKYIYLLDKPLEKILIRYERVPSQFTTVIFPDGSQPCTALTTSKYKNSKFKSFNKHHLDDSSHDSSTKVALRTVTTTTTLSRYLYHRRWIWGSGCSHYSKYSTSEAQKLQLQLERTISILTKLRLREGFRFAHSSAGIINMVLQVDMIEGSSSCPSTPTSHCVIQYVLFPPNLIHKQLQKNDYTSIVDMLKRKNNDARSSSSSIEEQQFGDSYNCCSLQTTEDDYQLVMECWIEPQHGSVVVNKEQNNNYMSGLMYEQLPDAIWQVDSNCINSLFTFQQMQYLCMSQNYSTTNTDIDLDKRHGQNKTVIIDAGRIYKMPFTFSLVHFLPKCRHYSSMTFNLFTKYDTDNETDLNSIKNKQTLNNMLERSFYSRLRTINHQLFDVNNSNTSLNMDQTISKMNDQEIGQCFIKRVNESHLILTVAPSYTEDKYNMDNSSEDSLQPIGRSRANTWHHTKRSVGQSFSSLCVEPRENSMHYYRTMSVGSKPYYNTTNDIDNNTPWSLNKLERSLSASETKSSLNFGNIGSFLQDLPAYMNIDVYDCRQSDLENILISNSRSFDHNLINDYSNENNSNSSDTSNSDENEEDNLYISNKKKNEYDETVDPLLLDKYLHKIQVIYDRSFVTTVFHALHLRLDVPNIDIQHAIDRCQHRLISFEITDYIKVICAHFKNANCPDICSAYNQTLKNHHNMIRSTFASILDRHMLRSIPSHPDYYFYDLTNKLEYENDLHDNYYMNKQSSNDVGQKYDTNRRVEFMNQKNENESIENTNFTDLKVSIDVYCFMLPNYSDDDDDDDEEDRFNETNNYDPPHFPISNDTTLQSLTKSGYHEDPFVYLSSSLPPKYAQGLAAFITEAEWFVHDEMAAGFLEIPIVTPDTLEKVIEHISKSPNSSLNEHLQIPVHFVVPSSSPEYNSVSLFLQKLHELDIIVDHGNGDEFYVLEKSTSDKFYVVKKYIQCNTDNTLTENTNIEGIDIYDSEKCLNNVECFTLILPNFWVILKIHENKPIGQKENNFDNNITVNTLTINVYFHCRFTELNVQKKYSAIKEVIGQNVRQVATIVNQTLLLCRLHDTRTCDSLLEPIIEDVVHSDDEDNIDGEIEKVTNHFTLGQFRCPVVWSTKFSLHPRLQHSTSMLLLGVQVLHTVLDKLSVRNRRNMFVYKESSGSVFYLRVYENSSQLNLKNNMVETYDSDDDDTISRCSSATSTTATISSSIFPSSNSNFSRKYSEDLNFMDNRSIQTPGGRSLGGGYWGDTDSRDVEDLTLKVHGISPVGTEIRVDLVEVLQNRLNDAVLEVLTTMLYRNPQCRLYPDDVRYIQPTDSRADFTMKVALPIETKITKLFVNNLKRNAASLLLYPPKYASRHHRFQYDTLENTEKPIIRSFYLYNQPSGGATAPSIMRGVGVSGNRGLACVLYEIYSNEENNLTENMDNYFTDPELFKKRIKITCIEDDLKEITDYSGFVKIFVWCRGRVNMEALQTKLTSIITYSLWDIYMEQFLKEQPIIIEDPPETHVNPLCIKYLAKWMVFGAQSTVALAQYSHIQCRIHISHVLREFKTHLSWFGISTSNNSSVSVRYFYVPRIQYDKYTDKFVSNNIITTSVDPLQLKQYDALTSDLKFYEWQISDNHPIICPPSAACVLIIVSVTSKIKTNQNHKQQYRKIEIELSDSDTDNGLFVPEDEENKNSEDGDSTTIKNDQSFNLVTLNTSTNNIKQNIVTDGKKYQKQQIMDTNKVTKLLLLAVSGESVHTLSYNCHNNTDQHIAINRLCRWLEWRSKIITSSSYNMMGLKNSQVYGQFVNAEFNGYSLKINNQDLLLDYKSYVTTDGEYESGNKITIGKISRSTSHTKSIDNDTDDKKNKSLQFNKDSHDLFIERLVKTTKQQRRTELYQKILYDMWIQGDAILTKESLRLFYHHSRLLHYCLTPLLFLPRWRFESAATRDHLVDALKTRNNTCPSPPHWHKRLCTRLSNAYSHYIQTNPFFSGFQLVQINKSRVFNDSVTTEIENTKSTTVHFKKSLPGVKGGLLLIETGICQPFYYLKLCCVERARLTNQVEYYEDKFKPPYSVIELCETIKRHMHLHSFTYDFHVRVLSERLSKLVQKEKTGKRNNYGHNLSMLLENRNIVQDNVNPPEKKKKKKKNAIAGFLDDYLKYYNLPPLYSSCLVLAGFIKRTKIPVTGLQLYKYLLDNCSTDCDGMAVLKICDSALADGEDGATLFDDDDDDDEDNYDDNKDDKNIADNTFQESRNSTVFHDLTDFIFVHHMAGSDIQRRQELETNSTYTNSQYEVCGLYDATLIMTLSSVRKLLLDANKSITLSYYVLLTNNENVSPEKNEFKEPTFKNTNNYIKQQRHSTPIRLSNHGFDQAHNLLSASVPSSSFANALTSGSPTCWGSLSEKSTWSQTPPNNFPHLKKKYRKYYDHLNDNLNSHQQQIIKKTKLIKFYEKKAAELVAHTVDTAANQCRLHLLWEKFGAHYDQRKLGAVTVTIEELEELLNKSPVMKPLSKYEKNIGSLVIEVCKGSQWFTSLYKLISTLSPQHPTTPLSVRCRIYNCYNSDRQYLVVLPHRIDKSEITTFIIIDNGIGKLPSNIKRSDSLVNIVFRRNITNAEEINILVEAVVNSMCFYIWRTIVSANASLAVDNRSSTSTSC